MLQQLENQLIYLPSRFPDGFWSQATIVTEDVYFKTDDGLTLHGWLSRCPEGRPNLLAGAERPMMLYCHGNAGNISHRIGNIAQWQQAVGIDVFIFDYRGYGKSEGKPFEAGLYLDSRAAYRWLTQESGVSADRLFFLGRSLGGAVALELALAVEHRCLILESTFLSMPEVAAKLYPYLPVRQLMTTRLDNAERIGRYTRPILISHGTKDSLIPIDHARRLFELAREPKQLLEVPGADHNDVAQVGGGEYFHAMTQFLSTSLLG